MNEEVLKILYKKNLDLWWFSVCHTLGWYNGFRRHKLINKKLTEYEFQLLKKELAKGVVEV